MAGVRFTELQSRPTEFLDFTSVTLDEFQQLVPPFETAFQCHMAAWRMDGKPRTARRFTVYKNCPLPTPEDRLLFILTYVKTYALQLAVIGQKLGKQALQEVAKIVKPDTIVGWHRKFVAQKFDGSQQRKAPGRPTIAKEVEDLVVRMAQENRSWGYDRIVGALANLGYTISGQTVGNILKRHGLPPAPERKTTTTWKEFIRTHMEVLVATDFFTAEVWTLGGLVTYYVLFFLHLGSRQVHVVGVTPHPNEAWMVQVARNVTMEEWGFLAPGQYLIHDRDTKFCAAFQQLIDAAGVKRVPLPPRSPNLNAYAER